jgi:hypothetical protein
MSVRTEADDAIDRAKDHINSAYKELSKALDKDTWGSDDYKEEYMDKVQEAALLLLKIKRSI